jgi:hypothetical protein
MGPVMAPRKAAPDPAEEPTLLLVLAALAEAFWPQLQQGAGSAEEPAKLQDAAPAAKEATGKLSATTSVGWYACLRRCVLRGTEQCMHLLSRGTGGTRGCWSQQRC